ncbi:hypothetical protein ACFU6S_23880 [Streptomyces sp. NPDC057456]|uniref:hypothetical protein n=1 Tax=Streptomyces sp. NPDC057456 TaxID=3346139 RepID=UPI0036AFCFAD
MLTTGMDAPTTGTDAAFVGHLREHGTPRPASCAGDRGISRTTSLPVLRASVLSNR